MSSFWLFWWVAVAKLPKLLSTPHRLAHAHAQQLTASNKTKKHDPIQPPTPPPPPVQAAWATMASGGGDPSSPSQSSTPAKDINILTGSDLVKGGDAPILLASDALGRVGLLRFPAQLPDPPASPPAPKDAAGGGFTARAVNATLQGCWLIFCTPHMSSSTSGYRRRFSRTPTKISMR